MPPVPEFYDSNYIPLGFAIKSTPEEDIFQVVDDVKKNVDKHVTQVIYISFFVGALGLSIVLLIIYFMSIALTAPLEYMNSTADGIINHFGSSSSLTEKTENFTTTRSCHCFPRTELDDVLQEFNEMVVSLSGSLASGTKCVRVKYEEILNEFEMRQDFAELYKSRNEKFFPYRVGKIGNSGGDGRCINQGIIFSNEQTLRRAGKPVEVDDKDSDKIFISRLFFWTVVLIGTPLLVTTIAMSVIVMVNMSAQFHKSIDAAKSFYLQVELNALSVYANLRANLVSNGASRPIRDLYILTRYASWLLFSGVERAVSFTEVVTGVESCKAFSKFNITECELHQKTYFCDCAWNEHGQTCNNYMDDTRARQKLYFSCQATDSIPNGDRYSTSFPNASYSPESTVWWDDVRTLPGSEKGAFAAGYETTYDRLRVISASPVHQVVYNQDAEKSYTFGSDVAFEADGMYVGFHGCGATNYHAITHWTSTEANGASQVRPELCPVGKYGFDPRCRAWYDEGKKKAETDGTPLHVTPPFVYADSRIGQIATSPLIDPQTKDHVGQVSISFISGEFLEYLDDKNTPLSAEGFPILITTLPGADSIIGPGFSLREDVARPISELVIPYEHKCNETDCISRRTDFEQIVSAMKGGERGNAIFTRVSSSGSEETLHIAYAPVVLRGYRILNSSDFSRGVQLHEVLTYSLALAETEQGLLEPFEPIEEAIEKNIRVTNSLLSAIVFLAILFAIHIISLVTLSLSDQMLVLLGVIQSINRLNVDEELPIVNHSNGSREMINVSDTIQTLYKVVRCGNYALFCEDVEGAYYVLHDMYRLFHHLDNEKAIGVVSNNLGNLLLIAFRAMDKVDEDHFCGMTKAEVINKGISFYYDAIRLGEKAYDEIHEIDGWSPNSLLFMQHLSNRYFNRGMFLLTVKDGHTQPDELERLGFQDIDIAIDLDMEIVDAGSTAGWDYETRVLKKFDVDLVRVKGHLALQELGYHDRSLGQMLDDIFWMVKKVKKGTLSSLFQTIMATGRLQEIETELIRFNLRMGDVKVAAQIGIRMLFEDELVFVRAQEKALEALSCYVDRTMDDDDDRRMELKRRLTASQAALAVVSSDMENNRTSVISTLSVLKRPLGREFKFRRSIVDATQRDYLTMEGF